MARGKGKTFQQGRYGVGRPEQKGVPSDQTADEDPDGQPLTDPHLDCGCLPGSGELRKPRRAEPLEDTLEEAAVRAAIRLRHDLE